MPSAELENLARIRQLKAEPAAAAEFLGLLKSGQDRLTDARNQTLRYASRFDLAYNAAHAFSLAALRWHGYRSENRYQVFQCLQHTVGLPPELWRVLDRAHRIRNMAEYEGEQEPDESLLAALIRVTEEVAVRAEALGPLKK